MADYIKFGGVHVDFNTNIIMIGIFLCVLVTDISRSPVLVQLVRNRYGETCVCPVVNHFHFHYYYDHDHDHDHDHHLLLRHREVRR
ncbi:hypothetical protein CNMCM8980_009420 [Aspergillus fumigatiaffinis]|uniref:Uncharacterized protein n=1 Tax=Aspergillus fumigatiaffinis TaxID=340414 RepID=A0A8H4M8Y2_9EURO|nr:hypothetical protein CNMCM5878_001093 [Aspergillus fumigatiaffinis]KAF4224327.1 hypothetical protein CNMCM6457_009554 [Aspergillus fumigatiaffinis]KAF4232964.1 hypothetical protein CNMCM6805_009587 [Aspergillus fumigatiaffinis]KAF4245734.1 hypothetical protein CNMCM8980_009420 [Aspergillus fumigatiaffinis]